MCVQEHRQDWRRRQAAETACYDSFFSGRVMVNSRLKLKRAETLLQDASCHPIKSMLRVVRNPLRMELHISGADDGRPRRRNENLSLGVIQRGIRHDRNPNALSFEDLVMCEDWIDTYFEFARKQVWQLQKEIYRYKDTHSQTCETFLQNLGVEN